MSSHSCSFASDNVWGPAVQPCRRLFDFTLLFEQSIFSILPSSIFLLLAFGRYYQLWQQPNLVTGWTLLGIKLVSRKTYREIAGS